MPRQRKTALSVTFYFCHPFCGISQGFKIILHFKNLSDNLGQYILKTQRIFQLKTWAIPRSFIMFDFQLMPLLQIYFSTETFLFIWKTNYSLYRCSAWKNFVKNRLFHVAVLPHSCIIRANKAAGYLSLFGTVSALLTHSTERFFFSNLSLFIWRTSPQIPYWSKDRHKSHRARTINEV